MHYFTFDASNEINYRKYYCISHYYSSRETPE